MSEAAYEGSFPQRDSAGRVIHLWEMDHPYYCEGSDYAYESWADFYDNCGNTDPDMNLVFRWDWIVPDPSDHEADEEVPAEVLRVFWVLQRKAILRSTECVVTREDEPAVRAWLEQRAETIRAIWEPIQ